MLRRRASGRKAGISERRMKSSKCRTAFPIPAQGAVDYQYLILPTHFTEDRWVQKVEVRPSNRSTVHHAVVYIREPGSKWLEGRAARDNRSPCPSRRVSPPATCLMVYTPGNSFDQWPPGIAKRIKAGSDLVLQMHYTANGKATEDRTRIGIVFAKAAAQASRALATDE